MTMRQHAIDNATRFFDDGEFLRVLRRRVGMRTESQEPGRHDELAAYLTLELAPSLQQLGFSCRAVPNPRDSFGPFLFAHRHEGNDLPTVLIYGHGDTVRCTDELWRAGLKPLEVTIEGDHWYGRGTADNKGQHTINFAALDAVLSARGGRLGFNAKVIMEMGEETGSPGLHEVCRRHRSDLAADVLIASDGPRLAVERPTLFLGSRGVVNFDLSVDLRTGAHHSGNWGGLLRNPGTVLANAMATLVDKRGTILVEGLRPPPIPDAVRRSLQDLKVGDGANDPAIDHGWGEPGLTNEERLFGWNTLEVLAFKTGDPDQPLNAIPPSARATMQFRFVVGTEAHNVVSIVQDHLDRNGFPWVTVEIGQMVGGGATRVDPDDPWVTWALDSIVRTTSKKPGLLPNFGGWIPNDAFVDILGMPTLWVPHSYPGCSQHAPDEHLLDHVAAEGLTIMVALFDEVPTGPGRRA